MEMSRQKSLKQRIEASEDRASVSDSGIARSRIRVKEGKRQWGQEERLIRSSAAVWSCWILFWERWDTIKHFEKRLTLFG